MEIRHSKAPKKVAYPQTVAPGRADKRSTKRAAKPKNENRIQAPPGLNQSRALWVRIFTDGMKNRNRWQIWRYYIRFMSKNQAGNVAGKYARRKDNRKLTANER